MANIWLWCLYGFALGMGVMFLSRKYWVKQPAWEEYLKVRSDNYELKHNLDKAKEDMAFMLAHAVPLPTANTGATQGQQRAPVDSGKDNGEKASAPSVSPYGEVLLLQQEWAVFKQKQKEEMKDFQDKVKCDLRYLRESITSAQTPTLPPPAARNPRIKKYRPPFIHYGKK